MAINPLIINKIDDLDIPNKMKEILKEVLKIEETMTLLNEKNYKNMEKILKKYADDDDVKGFCSKYVS